MADTLKKDTLQKAVQRLWDREVGKDVDKFVYKLAGEKGKTYKGGAHLKPYVDLYKSLGSPTDDAGVKNYLKEAILQITSPNLMKYTNNDFATYDPQRQIGLIDFDYWVGINNWGRTQPFIQSKDWTNALSNILDAKMFQKAMVERSKLKGAYNDPNRQKSTYGGWIPRMYQIFKDLTYGSDVPSTNTGMMDFSFNKLLDRELHKGLAQPDLVKDIEQKIKEKNNGKGI